MTAAAPPSTRLDPDALVALEEQRDFLLASIDDLDREREAGDIDEPDYSTLRDDYTARAAEVLRAIDERRRAFADARRPRSTGRIVTIVAAVLVFATVAGVLVAHALGARTPTSTATGDIRRTPSQDARLCVNQINPGADPRPALQCFQKVLDRDPQNAVALAYQGWALNVTVMSTAGFPAAEAEQFRADAARFVAQSVRSDPQYPDALAFATIIAYQRGRPAEAKRSLAALDRSHPPAEITSLIKQFRIRENIEKALRAQSKSG